MKPRKINAAAFKRQLAEYVVGPDSIEEVELNAERTIRMRLSVNLDPDEYPDHKRFIDKLEIATSEEDTRGVALAFLDVPGQDAEEALSAANEAGITTGDLMNMWQVETGAARERLGNFRYKA